MHKGCQLFFCGEPMGIKASKAAGTAPANPNQNKGIFEFTARRSED
jgi:hypothetical protein